jgi:hypothetical protein
MTKTLEGLEGKNSNSESIMGAWHERVFQTWRIVMNKRGEDGCLGSESQGIHAKECCKA